MMVAGCARDGCARRTLVHDRKADDFVLLCTAEFTMTKSIKYLLLFQKLSSSCSFSCRSVKAVAEVLYCAKVPKYYTGG